MRFVIIFIAVVFGLPALAQSSAVCSGKPTFELNDGTTGCLLDVRPTQVTRSVIRDDGQNRKNSRDAALIEVALFGTYTEAWGTSTPRMRQVCGLFKDTAKSDLNLDRLRTVVVVKRWPAAGWPAATPAYKKRRSAVPFQAAMMNRNCRAISYFN